MGVVIYKAWACCRFFQMKNNSVIPALPGGFFSPPGKRPEEPFGEDLSAALCPITPAAVSGIDRK
ncbi:MAG: hypothetical protein HY520_00660 [Candidatus Aenigmarchaeota archaeon]|nr:hypothetical protein [Candidatus Aenigmarchaeota archaeon]